MMWVYNNFENNFEVKLKVAMYLKEIFWLINLNGLMELLLQFHFKICARIIVT